MTEEASKSQEGNSIVIDKSELIRQAKIADFLQPLHEAEDGLGFSKEEQSAILRYAEIVGEAAAQKEKERQDSNPLTQIDRIIEGIEFEVSTGENPHTQKRLQQLHSARELLRKKFIEAHNAADEIGLRRHVNSSAEGVTERLNIVSHRLDTEVIDGEKDVDFVEKIVRAFGTEFEGSLGDYIDPQEIDRMYSLLGPRHSYYTGLPTSIPGVKIVPYYAPKVHNNKSKLTGKPHEVGFSLSLYFDENAARKVLNSPQLPTLPNPTE